MSLKVLGNRIVLEFTENKEEKKMGGIIIPTTVEDKSKERIEEVVAVGKDVADVKVGDKVLIINGMGALQEHEGSWFIIMREVDIIAVVEDED